VPCVLLVGHKSIAPNVCAVIKLLCSSCIFKYDPNSSAQCLLLRGIVNHSNSESQLDVTGKLSITG